MTALELYAGIGGFAEAAQDRVRVVGACDASSHALEVYRHNFEHPTHQISLVGDVARKLAGLEAEMWWMSPPCTPHTRRGLKKDLADPRAETFEATLTAIGKVRPARIGFENVAGFVDSRAHRALLATLVDHGYRFSERVICPTELGIPNRRPRYYLAASLEFLPEFSLSPGRQQRLIEFVNEVAKPKFVPDRIIEKYAGALLRVERDDPDAETACFTSAYGKSWVFSGSYLVCEKGLRFFDDTEVAAMLGFKGRFGFPEHFGRRHRWKLLGNSLSIPAVREVLAALRL